jgi:excisionase family DNA binding protein
MKSTERLAVDILTAAAMLSVSPRTIEAYISKRMLPARKLGRRTVIRMRDLEAFLRADQPQASTKSERHAELVHA